MSKSESDRIAGREEWEQSKPATASTWTENRHRRGGAAVHPGALPTHFAVTNLDIDVTENCNLGCLYCFKNEKFGENMSLKTMKAAFEWLLLASGQAPSVNCNFMGGEPTMRFKQIKAFVPWARRRGAAVGKKTTFSMTSNLTLFTDEIRQFIDDYGFGLLMSIDGCPRIQDTQRPAKNGVPMSQIVERWAKSVLRTRPGSQARATLHPDHVDSLLESVEYIHSIGFREMALSLSEYPSWGEDEFRKLDSQLSKVVDYVADIYSNGGDFCLSNIKCYVNLLVHPRYTEGEPAVKVSKQPCGAGKGYMRYGQELCTGI